MEKNCSFSNRQGHFIKKLIQTMKLSLLLATITMNTAIAGSLLGQDYQVSLNLRNASAVDVFREIEMYTNLGFVYRNDQINHEKLYSFQIENAPVSTVLDQVLSDQNASFRIVDDYIVILGENIQNRIARDTLLTVSGIITDSYGDPVPGVTILIKGTAKGSISAADGRYSIASVPQGATLTYSFVGMIKKEVNIWNQTQVDVTMHYSFETIDEVVVVGYGTVNKRDLTGSVSKISAAEFENRPVSSPAEYLLGTVAGLNYDLSSSARPGSSFEIRGPTSLSASNDPLIVLDGVIFNGTMSDINPNDIASFDILKDGSSAAVYGARASNGVIIITTKTGDSETPKIQFDAKVGLASLIDHQRPFGPEKYLTARRDALISMYPNRNEQYPYYFNDPRDLPSDVDLDTWLNYDPGSPTDPLQVWTRRLQLQNIEEENFFAGKTTDWYDMVFQTGIRQDYNLALSGKTKLLNYYWSLGSTSNEGIVVDETFEKIRSRVNLSADVTNYLQVGINALVAFDDNGDQPVNWGEAINASPYGEIYDSITVYKWYPHDDNMAQNPFENTLRDVLDKHQSLMSTLFAKLALPFGFKYEINFTNRAQWSQDYEYRPKTTRSGNNSNGFAERQERRYSEWQIDNILRWNQTISDHSRIDLTLLYNAEQYRSFESTIESSDFVISEALGYNAMHLGNIPVVSSNDQYETGAAMMARLNYALFDKYLFTASFRRDGYSAFGQSNPWANFPAAAFAWRISDESFMDGVSAISNLKWRASWGINGNRSVGRYEALSRLNQTTYIIGGQTVIGLYPTNLPNSNLRWERTTSYNTGLDIGILNNRISATLDAYLMLTNDLLLTRALPDITGYNDVISNLGEIENRGLEATISSINVITSQFNWKSRFIFSMNRNKINHLYGTMVDVLDEEGNVIGQREDDDIQNDWYIGHALDEIYEYQEIGVWQEDEAEEAYVYGRLPGDYKLYDVNGDGTYTPEDDNVWIGFREPRYRLSLMNSFTLLNGLEVSFLLRSYLGHLDRVNELKHSSYYDRINHYDTPYWTPDNPLEDYARLASISSPGSFNVWRSASFVRIQDLSIAYKLPGEFAEKLRLTSARVYLNFNNLYSFDTWDLWDPETNDPTPFISTLGLSIVL
jgi:TonB-dependent starch-binding outer membrane protein SusC